MTGSADLPRSFAVFAGLMLLAVCLSLGVMTWLVQTQSRSALERLVDADMASLVLLLSDRGNEDFAESLEEITAFTPLDTGERRIGFRYMRGAQTIDAGTLKEWPDLEPARSEMAVTPLPGETGQWIVRTTRLRGPAELLVAREAAGLGVLLRQTLMIAAGAVILLAGLAIITGYFLTSQVTRRVTEIADVCDRIGAGDMHDRLHDEREDGLGRISRHIDRMLDRVERTVAGQKQVADQIAHEVRSPLGRVNARLETLAAARSLDAEDLDALEAARSDLRRLTMTLDDVLDISALETRGHDRSGFQDVHLSAILNSVHDLFAAVAEDAGIDLEMRVEDDLTVAGDAASLRRMIANLVDNALRATPEGGKITVKAGHDDGRRFVLDVEDTGRGLPEGREHLLFERFSAPRSDEGRPGGMGLAFVKAIAGRHGWSVSAQNTGSGARFSVQG